MKISKKCNTENYSFLVNDTTLSSYNHLHFRKHLLDKKLFKSEYIVNYEEQLIIRLMMKNNMELNEKLQKYGPYHQAKLINMNILQVKKYSLEIKKIIIEQNKFIYSPSRKAFEEETS